jgi:hypothetical protein
LWCTSRHAFVRRESLASNVLFVALPKKTKSERYTQIKKLNVKYILKVKDIPMLACNKIVVFRMTDIYPLCSKLSHSNFLRELKHLKFD